MIGKQASPSRMLTCIIALVLLVSLIVPAVSCGEPEATTTTKMTTTTPTTTPFEPITLVFACFESNTGIMYDLFWKPWLEEVEKRTGGKVKIEAHFNGELAAPPDAWDVLVNGTVDISYHHLQNQPGKFPMCEIVAFTSYGLVNDNLSQTLLDLYNKYPEMRQELEEVHLMMLGSTYWTSYAGTVPVHTLEDMDGLKALGIGNWQNKRAEALGMVPVSMGPFDILPSLQTGVIDGGGNGTMLIALDFGYMDYLDYWTHFRMESIPLIIAMNNDVWDSLPADIQQILDEMVPWTTALWDNMWVETEHTLYPEILDQLVEFYTPPDEELARWDAVDKPVWDEYAEELESMGLPGRALMDDYIELEQQYSYPVSEWSP